MKNLLVTAAIYNNNHMSPSCLVMCQRNTFLRQVFLRKIKIIPFLQHSSKIKIILCLFGPSSLSFFFFFFKRAIYYSDSDFRIKAMQIGKSLKKYLYKPVSHAAVKNPIESMLKLFFIFK